MPVLELQCPWLLQLLGQLRSDVLAAGGREEDRRAREGVRFGSRFAELFRTDTNMRRRRRSAFR